MTKALSWRLIASLTTTVLVYVVTGNAQLSVGIGAIDLLVKLLLYYMHERAWARVSWGRRRANASAPESVASEGC